MTTEPTAPRLVFFDDARARAFEPFALSRPFSEMRVGAVLLRERWEHVFGAGSAGFIGAPQLAGFEEHGAPPVIADVVPAGSILINSRAAVSLALSSGVLQPAPVSTEGTGPTRVWTIAGKVAAYELPQSLPVAAFDAGAFFPALDDRLRDDAEGAAHVELDGTWIDEVWDIVRHLTPLLLADIPVLARARSFANVSSNNNGPVVTGRHALYVEDGATVEPFTFVDTTDGPVLVRRGSTVQAFTRIVGPCYIGRSTTVVADRISGSAIGDTCRVHGELSATVLVGESNKGHDGFVGHSIIGRWVNLGAGTTTSNLKNTYGTVALWTPDGVRETGLQFLGTLFGDHVKTGIGLKLTTGCVLGTAANVFDTMPPKVVAPFSWGGGAPYAAYDVEKFLQSAERMMARRRVTLTDSARAGLRAVHAARWQAR